MAEAGLVLVCVQSPGSDPSKENVQTVTCFKIVTCFSLIVIVYHA